MDIEVDNKPNGTDHISTYSPAKLGEMIKHFEDLSRQGYIERVDTPLEKLLKRTIKKAEEKADFPAEVPDILFKEEKILCKINLKDSPLAGLKNYPIADENDIIVFLQTGEVIFEILKQAQIATGLSPEKIRQLLLSIQATILADKKTENRFVLPSAASSLDIRKIYRLMDAPAQICL